MSKSKFIIVSNRLPIRIEKQEDVFVFEKTSGGLATGMNTIHDEGGSLWIGWPGINREEIGEKEYNNLSLQLVKNRFKTISLSAGEIDDFYLGLSNKCIWPLFHYFTQHFQFNEEQWEAYVKVNQRFADAVIEEAEDGDKIWVHDYQLLLVPEMIRAVKKNVFIGFFLHIPFPSFEILRIFPKREELLTGMLGADLIGFHTYDFRRHFISSVKRALRLDVNFHIIEKANREIEVNIFPMGIDFQKFESISIKHSKTQSSFELREQLENHRKTHRRKTILSIDRLDYTKGIVNRIKSFELFLERHPKFKEKVTLVVVAVPSRSGVSHYQELKRETDEIVGRVNGKFATVTWTPIWYYYRSFAEDDLVDLYALSDIAMVTPFRDGMNLIAKEYLATRIKNDGVLILSELAGAAKELHSAIIVNPFDLRALSSSIYKALKMPVAVQREKMIEMRERVKKYDVKSWADHFLKELERISKKPPSFRAVKIDKKITNDLVLKFKATTKRLFLLDYDGTLVGFHKDPNKANASKDLIKFLKILSEDKRNTVVIISGRPAEFLDKQFKNLNITLIAEHGHLEKLPNGDWERDSLHSNRLEWMEHIYPFLGQFTDNTPGAFVEKKKNSLAVHYRGTANELGVLKSQELRTVLADMLTSEINLLYGDKVLEVVSSYINKGTVSYKQFIREKYDFVFVAGDDVTDENMFNHLPKRVISVKIGKKKTEAKYFVNDPAELLKILKLFKN